MRRWHQTCSEFVNCDRRRGDDNEPLASTVQRSMPYFLFESVGSLKAEPMQIAPLESATRFHGLHSVAGSVTRCISESVFPVERNTRTLSSQKEAMRRCSPTYWRLQM